MALAELIGGGRERSGVGNGIEYGSDGSPWGGVAWTPWPGVMNDVAAMPWVTEQVAEGLPGLGRGVELISGVMAQLQPLLFTGVANPLTPTTVVDTPPLLQNPDPLWHGLPEWMTAVVASLFWHGDAFAYRGAEVCDYRGYPTRLPLLAASSMSWDTSEGAGSLYTGDYLYTGQGGQTRLAPSEVAHFLVGARAGERFGLGVLERYQTELKIMVATENAQYVLMKDGKPMGILSLGVDVNQDQAKDYKEGFLNAVRESGVAAIGNADFKPVQWSSADLSMIPTREFNLRLASDISGVPPYLLGVPSESRVYANMETEWATFIRVTLGRYLRSIESVLSSCFPRTSSVLIDTEDLLRGDAAARWAVYTAASGLKAMTVDEIRTYERMPPLTAAQKAELNPPAPVLAPATDPDDDEDDDTVPHDEAEEAEHAEE